MDKESGQSILDTIDALHEPEMPVEEPMRENAASMSILDALRRSVGEQRAGSAEDIEQLRRENSRLQCILDAYQAALDRHAIVAVTDRSGKILFVNGRFCSISGYSAGELLGQQHRIVNSRHHPRAFFVQMWKTIVRGDVWHGEICNRAKSGTLYWVDTTIVPMLGRQGRVDAYVSIRYDITKRKLAESALHAEVSKRRQAESLLRDVIETVPDGIAAFDENDRLILHNQAYVDFYDRAGEAIRMGATFEEIVRSGLERGQYAIPLDDPGLREDFCQARLREHQQPGKISVHALHGGRWLLANERKSSSGYTIGTRTDITELKRSEAAAKYHAEHDPLTNLYNRSVLHARLSEAIGQAAGTRSGGALIVADLDGFKQVNDTMGHAAGDALLLAVARRMQSAVRKSDTVIRLGGDEFAVIVPQLDVEDAGQLAERIIAAVVQPVAYQKHAIKPQLSLGISLFPRDGRTVESLLKKADMALYKAKTESGSACRIFSRAMRSQGDRQRKQADDLAAAIAADEIDIALQPQFRLSDGMHSGFEALARWRHAGQPVSPADFIPVAEQHGLIVGLGRRVLHRTLQAIRDMKGENVGKVAVNIAADQLRMSDFPSALLATVEEYGLSPAVLELELTENILLDREQEQIGATLRQFRQMGFSIALDDFGTGYASLSHLSRFPVNKLKIDRSFVRDMLTNPDVMSIVRAMVGLAHSLGMHVIAEGIETAGQLDRLRDIQCDFGQGYIVSPPLGVRHVPGFLAGRPR